MNKLNGYFEEYYPKYKINQTINKIKSKGNYINGEKNGLWEGYYDNGMLKYKTFYCMGEILHSTSFYLSGQTESIFKIESGLRFYYKNGKCKI